MLLASLPRFVQDDHPVGPSEVEQIVRGQSH